MTKLHFNYKDTFRALRLGFSAKKVWMMSLGLLVGFSGYTVLSYVAYLAAGVDILTVWQQFRLLPFPSPLDYPFPWFAWIIYGVGAAFWLCAVLVTGTAVSKVCFEQIKGDEFYESREAFRFGFKHAGSVLLSPLLILAFIAIIVILGLAVSGIGAIPYVGEIAVGILSPVALVAALFIVYLLVALTATVLMAPSVVGASRSDTFDTLFEVFSCVNEQPGRLLWYSATVAVLGKLGAFLFGWAASAASRIAYSILLAFMGDKMAEAMTNASFYFKVSLPEWWPAALQQLFITQANVYGLPQMYLPSEYLSIGWSSDIASLFIGITIYLAALMVLGFGLSVWFCGMTLNYAVLANKKDNRNILESTGDLDEELIEPPPLDTGAVPPAPETKVAS
jgi:hypothetical protein